MLFILSLPVLQESGILPPCQCPVETDFLLASAQLFLSNHRMPEWFAIILLGIVEGITEFLPVSSTGHLLLAEHWLPRQSDLFNVVIQTGAVLAVLPLFRERIESFRRWREPASRDYLLKAIVAFVITGIGGLILEKKGFKLPEAATPVAWALLIGGIFFLAVESRSPWARVLLGVGLVVWIGHMLVQVRQGMAEGSLGSLLASSSFLLNAALFLLWIFVLWASFLRHQEGATCVTQISWSVVLAVGIGQLIAAVYPGASRSGTTIMLALLLGLCRPAATEFSFLVSIPTMVAAGGLKIFKQLHHATGTVHEDWAMVALGTVAAVVVSFIVVKWFLRFVQSHTFVGFGWYRIALGIGMLILVR
jgi:undecaprenyl-diphosphatase